MKFEEYIHNQFWKETDGCLDDDYPDCFDSWFCDREFDDWVNYAEAWHKQENEKDSNLTVKECLDNIKSDIKGFSMYIGQMRESEG